MHRDRSLQVDGVPPGAESTRYAPERIFDLSKIAHDGPKVLLTDPLPTARLLISRGLSAIRENKNNRIGKIWRRLSGHDHWR